MHYKVAGTESTGRIDGRFSGSSRRTAGGETMHRSTRGVRPGRATSMRRRVLATSGSGR